MMDLCIFLVIGKGGEQITRLQAESGCKVQIAPGLLSFLIRLHVLKIFFELLKNESSVSNNVFVCVYFKLILINNLF